MLPAALWRCGSWRFYVFDEAEGTVHGGGIFPVQDLSARRRLYTGAVWYNDRRVCFGPYTVAGGVPRVFPDLSAAGVVHQVFGNRHWVYVVRLAVPFPV